MGKKLDQRELLLTEQLRKEKQELLDALDRTSRSLFNLGTIADAKTVRIVDAQPYLDTALESMNLVSKTRRSKI